MRVDISVTDLAPDDDDNDDDTGDDDDDDDAATAAAAAADDDTLLSPQKKCDVRVSMKESEVNKVAYSII